MQRTGRLGCIWPRSGCGCGTRFFEEVFIECIGNLRPVKIGNGPENDQGDVSEPKLINSPHSRDNPTETNK
jgi:hypothetical protein